MRAVLLALLILVASCGSDGPAPMDEYCLAECRQALGEEVLDAAWMGNDQWWTRCSCLTLDGEKVIHVKLKLSDRPENRRQQDDP